MTPTKPPSVTPAQWLAVLAIWGLAAYGLIAGPPAGAKQEQVQLIACR